MALEIKKIEYYNITVNGHGGEGAKLLSGFADMGINLLAFKAVAQDKSTLFTLIPDNSIKMNDGAKKAGLDYNGPHPALLINGDNDESGELASIFEKLSQANIPVNESCGMADIKESYGVILYLKQEDCDKALAVLKK